jgi:hypothetical protein
MEAGGRCGKLCLKTLSLEAGDIPQEEIDQAPWILAKLDAADILTDQKLIADHDRDPVHILRKDNFIDLIKRSEELLPLIVLGKNQFLVDGYARFRALRDLGITNIMVCKQRRLQ